MIIIRTPLRISFFGGGTDHPAWFSGIGKGMGAVLSSSINKYIYLTLRRMPPIFDYKYRVAWKIVEQTSSISEIQHPVIRAVLQHYAVDDGCGYEVSFNSDLPARSGLGSSSAFTVAALHAIHANAGRSYSKHSLCQEAIHLEQNILREPVGSQDQVAVGYGGFNRIDFLNNGDFSVSPVEIAPRRFELFQKHIMLFFTGFTRDAGNIEKSKFDSITPEKAKSLEEMYHLVERAQSIIEDPRADLSNLGLLLDETWRKKRSLSKDVSNEQIDLIYNCAIKAGAYGGKLLGAGGGGFLLFFAHPELHHNIRNSLSKLGDLGAAVPIEVQIGLENSGSKIILHQDDFESLSSYDVQKFSLELS